MAKIPSDTELYREAGALPGLTFDREWRTIRLVTGDIEVTTGSGSEMGVLIFQLAQAVSEGMIGFTTSLPDA